MKYNIRYLPEAEFDIYEKIDFLKKNKVSNKIINNLYNFIKATIVGLDLFPQRFPIVYKDFRRVLIKKYSIFYKIDENKKEVVIYRILHQSQNFEGQL